MRRSTRHLSQVPDGTRRYRWVVLASATLTQACACFLVQGLGVMGPALQRDLHLSSTGLGLLMSAAQIAPIVGLVVAGELLDRFGERPVVALGVGWVALALAGASTAQGLASLMFWMACAGIGYSTVQPGGSQAVSRWFSRSQRGLAMGIRQSGLPLGGAFAALVLPSVAAAGGWRAGLLAGSAVAALGAVAFVTAYRAPRTPTAVAAPGGAQGLGSRMREYLLLLRLPSLQSAAWAGCALIAVQVSLLVFTVPDLHQRFGMGGSAASQYVALMLVAGVVGRIVLGSWSDRCRNGRHVPVHACLAAMAIALMAFSMGMASTGLALFAWSAWAGFFGFGWYGPWITFVSEAAPAGRAGTTVGLVMMINQIALVTIPPVFGALKDFSGGFVLGWAALAIASLASLHRTRALNARHPHVSSLPPLS